MLALPTNLILVLTASLLTLALCRAVIPEAFVQSYTSPLTSIHLPQPHCLLHSASFPPSLLSGHCFSQNLPKCSTFQWLPSTPAGHLLLCYPLPYIWHCCFNSVQMPVTTEWGKRLLSWRNSACYLTSWPGVCNLHVVLPVSFLYPVNHIRGQDQMSKGQQKKKKKTKKSVFQTIQNVQNCLEKHK